MAIIDEDLITAVCENNLAALQSLYEAGAIDSINDLTNDGITLLHGAAAYDSIDCMKYLISKGADLDVKAYNDMVPLHYAIAYDFPRSIEYLLEAGANTSVILKGKTMEECAVASGNDAVIDIIRKWGNGDQIIFSSSVGDRIVEEIFDFGKMERFTYLRRPSDRVVECFSRDNFADVDEVSLTKAFAQHAKRGGKKTIADVHIKVAPFQRKAFNG